MTCIVKYVLILDIEAKFISCIVEYWHEPWGGEGNENCPLHVHFEDKYIMFCDITLYELKWKNLG